MVYLLGIIMYCVYTKYDVSRTMKRYGDIKCDTFSKHLVVVFSTKLVY